MFLKIRLNVVCLPVSPGVSLRDLLHYCRQTCSIPGESSPMTPLPSTSHPSTSCRFAYLWMCRRTSLEHAMPRRSRRRTSSPTTPTTPPRGKPSRRRHQPMCRVRHCSSSPRIQVHGILPRDQLRAQAARRAAVVLRGPLDRRGAFWAWRARRKKKKHY